MSNERDPRVDPRPGDEVEVNCDGYAMMARVGYTVNGYVVFATRSSTRASDLTLNHWREFARNARVVARGQEDRDEA